MATEESRSFEGITLAQKYTVVKRIGRGGMGEVYRARQLSTGGRVAIKIMDTADQPQSTLARFRYEAETTAQLTHPNTVRILDFGIDGSLFFIVMEYLSGTDLTRFLRAGGQSDAFVAHVMFQVACSLSEAHSRGVIHRDIKPNNVMLIHHVGHPSFVKVIDFGVARAIGGPGHGTHGILGTIGYIAPEQAKETTQPDARTDLYALGCVAYELLTGTLPFEGISHQSAPLDILEAHMGGRARHILDVKPEADIELAELIMSLIEREPRRRPESAGDLVVPTHAIRSRVSEGVGYSVDIPPPSSGEVIHRPTHLEFTQAEPHLATQFIRSADVPDDGLPEPAQENDGDHPLEVYSAPIAEGPPVTSPARLRAENETSSTANRVPHDDATLPVHDPSLASQFAKEQQIAFSPEPTSNSGPNPSDGWTWQSESLSLPESVSANTSKDAKGWLYWVILLGLLSLAGLTSIFLL